MPIQQLLWLLAAALVGFLVPYLFADLLDVPRDAYYALHGAAVFGFFALWARASRLAVGSMIRRNRKWALLLGAAAGAILAGIALTFDATRHPHGLAFSGAILWRGIVYGAADGLLLGAFPVLAVFTAFPFMRGRAHLVRTVSTGALALVAALAITAVYHLGYRDFRSSKVTTPLRGTAIWTAPTLLTLNPIGSVVAHVGQHVAAVVHSYDGDTYLPPHASAVPGIALRPCTIGGTSAECGVLRVAENPSQRDGTQIALNVAVVGATGDHAKPDPLFWFAGWGAAGVTDDAADVLSALTGVNDQRDLVFVDQRGTGSSQLVCPLPASGRVLDVAPAAVTAAARRCAARLGPNLRYYTSAVAVDDFDQVRRALGYETINVYGGSYGVTTGQIYLLRHGAHARTAVFDSGSLLDVRIFEQGGKNAQRALELLFGRCAADTACRTAYPHLAREFASLRARVARAPIPIPGSTLALTPVTLASALADAIAYTPGKASAPRLIHLVATGQIARAAALPPAATEAQTSDLAYKLLIQCNEPWASWRKPEVARLARGSYIEPLQQLNARMIGAACRGFPRADVPAAIGQRVHSNVPVLFLTGNEDPADPPANVANAQRELPNSRTVIFPAAGHGQLGLPCAQDLIAKFVARGTAAGLDTSCARYGALQPFDTSD